MTAKRRTPANTWISIAILTGTEPIESRHGWHSHTAILKLKIDKERCWICNENPANFLYEPFILQQMKQDKSPEAFLFRHGSQIAEAYWDTSLSYNDNIERRMDKKEGYDAEVLILHPIPPENIRCLMKNGNAFLSDVLRKDLFNTTSICIPKERIPPGIG